MRDLLLTFFLTFPFLIIHSISPFSFFAKKKKIVSTSKLQFQKLQKKAFRE